MDISSLENKSCQKRVLVVGQTPPPYGGQALMLRTLLDGKYQNAKLFHVRLEFSKDFNDMGSFKLYKFWGLFKAIILIWVYRFFHKANILYYGPAGPNKLAMYRDILLLFPTRFLFQKTILHTHAGGASSLYKNLNPIVKYFYRTAFFKPDILITLTSYSHGDDVILQPKKKFIVPNGIKDEYISREIELKAKKKEGINLLYVGAMYEERGIVELIEAVHKLTEKKIEVCLKLVGIFISSKFEDFVFSLVKTYQLENIVIFLGTKINEEKWQVFLDTDIFCFPTYVPSETFGIVLVEAMQFKIPIIATRWNGIPLVINDNQNGLLVNIQDSNELASKLELLISNEDLRNKLGGNGRKTYLEKYSIKTFLNNMDKVFSEL